MAHKRYVDVDVEFGFDGEMTPICVHWDDGRKFEIDEILDVSHRSSGDIGGCGLRYKCRIVDEITYLWYGYLEKPRRWYVSEK